MKRIRGKSKGEEVGEKKWNFLNKHLLAACSVPGTAGHYRENKLKRTRPLRVHLGDTHWPVLRTDSSKLRSMEFRIM